MKCIKNVKTENIVRVTDTQANQMVGNIWQYVSKSEWKTFSRTTVDDKKEKTVSEKAVKRSKLKEKQRK
jgi:hypothetical protein